MGSNIFEGTDKNFVLMQNIDAIKRAIENSDSSISLQEVAVALNTAHRNITTGNPHKIDAVDVPIVDRAKLIVADEVEGALAENRKTTDDHIADLGNPHEVIASQVPVTDTGSIITATDVEGALQENRTAIDLNTAKVSGVGFTTVAILGTL